jgi:hypothetical protein
MVGQNLNSRPDNQEHEKQVEKMVQSQPWGKTVPFHRRSGVARIIHQEGLHRWDLTKFLHHCDADEQKQKAQR